jgi:hypothetical protein
LASKVRSVLERSSIAAQLPQETAGSSFSQLLKND